MQYKQKQMNLIFLHFFSVFSSNLLFLDFKFTENISRVVNTHYALHLDSLIVNMLPYFISVQCEDY